MADFTPIDAGVAHMAMLNTLEAAKRRRERSPSSAASFERQAADLKVLRDKVLDNLPEQFHRHREAYPDYTPDPAIARTRTG